MREFYHLIHSNGKFQKERRDSHSDGMATKGVQYIGCPSEIEHHFGWPRVLDPFNLQSCRTKTHQKERNIWLEIEMIRWTARPGHEEQLQWSSTKPCKWSFQAQEKTKFYSYETMVWTPSWRSMLQIYTSMSSCLACHLCNIYCCHHEHISVLISPSIWRTEEKWWTLHKLLAESRIQRGEKCSWKPIQQPSSMAPIAHPALQTTEQTNMFKEAKKQSFEIVKMAVGCPVFNLTWMTWFLKLTFSFSLRVRYST